MSDKRRRRRRSSERAAAGERTTTIGPPGGQVKEERRQHRRDEARLQREAIRRAAVRRERTRKAVIGAVVLVLVAAGVGLFVRNHSAGVQRTKEQEALLAQAAAAEKAAGCGTVKDVGAYNPGAEDRQHTTAIQPLDSYPSQPPASGPHDPTPLGSGFYRSPPPIGRAIHSLEHGAAEVWYAPSASGPELDRIKQVLAGEDHVIIAPYQYPGAGGALPTGQQMALVAWHHVQGCGRVSAAVAVAFVRSYDASVATDYRGDAPEAGSPI